FAGMTLFLRSAADPAQLAPAVRREVAAFDPAIAVSQVQTLAERLAVATSRTRWLTWLLAAFAGLSLLLAASGVHALLSQLVAASRREIGIRLAVGASPREVVRGVIRRGGGLALGGLALGGALALGLGRFLEALLFEVAPADPAIFILSLVVLLAAALLAAWLPARRAARVEPLVALRAE
ncbi:MAG TPA: FtsX-like permease family protein, partial [Thermoanaerobaculia bacterium]|nr:FtsX-like permease family protein [Thermoanaerobaculia bacterium]